MPAQELQEAEKIDRKPPPHLLLVHNIDGLVQQWRMREIQTHFTPRLFSLASILSFQFFAFSSILLRKFGVICCFLFVFSSLLPTLAGIDTKPNATGRADFPVTRHALQNIQGIHAAVTLGFNFGSVSGGINTKQTKLRLSARSGLQYLLLWCPFLLA